MKGIELSERYFYEFGESMLKKEFGEYYDRMTIGLLGEGSECFGFDDELSADHDFEPGFCIFIDREIERKIGFKLERAYGKLPKEYAGYKKQTLAPGGGERRGVIVSEEYLTDRFGFDRAPITDEEWLRVPPIYLATISNGKIFHGGESKLLKAREIIMAGYPESVKTEKLSDCLYNAGQAGQYNYLRCVARNEVGAAALAVNEFVVNVLRAIYLLNDEYYTYYKWAFRGMRKLKKFSELEEPLVFLLQNPDDEENAKYKSEIIEDIASVIIAELKNRDMTRATCNHLDTHALSFRRQTFVGNV